jgi:hypothetical protein
MCATRDRNNRDAHVTTRCYAASSEYTDGLAREESSNAKTLSRRLVERGLKACWIV